LKICLPFRLLERHQNTTKSFAFDGELIIFYAVFKIWAIHLSPSVFTSSKIRIIGFYMQRCAAQTDLAPHAFSARVRGSSGGGIVMNIEKII
jgi:hypothetical protein